jgi:hypothetical protein
MLMAAGWSPLIASRAIVHRPLVGTAPEILYLIETRSSQLEQRARHLPMAAHSRAYPLPHRQDGRSSRSRGSEKGIQQQ